MARKKGFGFTIGLDIKSFEQNYKTLDKLVGSMSKKFNKTALEISDFARNIVAGVAAASAGLVTASISLGSEMDRLKTAFEGVWGGADVAADKYRKLQSITEATGFGLSELQQVDKILKSVGFDADSATTVLARLTNAVVATGGSSSQLQSLVDKLLDIKVTGRVSDEALKEFAKVGIEVDDLIGGKASKAVETLIDRLKKFDGVAQGESIDIWAQLTRAINIGKDAVADLGNYINDNLRGSFSVLVNIVDNARKGFHEWLYNDGVYQLFGGLQDLGMAITIVTLPSLYKLGVAFAPFALKAGAAALAVGLITEAIKDLTTEMNILKTIQNTLGLVFNKVSSSIKEFLLRTQLDILLSTKAIMDKIGSTSASSKLSSGILNTVKEIKQVREDAKLLGDYFYDEAKSAGKKLIDNSYTMKIYDKIKEIKLMDWAKPSTDFARLETGKVVAPEIIDRGSSEGKGSGSSFLSPDYWARMAGFSSAKSAGTEFKKIGARISKLFSEGIKEQASPLSQWLSDMRSRTLGNLMTGLNEALWSGKNVMSELGKSLNDLGKQILTQITQMLILTRLFKILGIGSASVGSYGLFNFRPVQDAVISPKGDIITTDPEDYLIATKTPETLGQGVGSASVIVNVNNNSGAEVTATKRSSMDGTSTIIDIVIDGYTRNVHGIRNLIGGR